MQRLILLLILVLGLNVSAWADVPVVDTAAIYQETLNMAELITQAKYLQQQLNAIKTLATANYQWGNVKDLIDQLGDVVAQYNGLSYNAQNLNSQFKAQFPGYQAATNFMQQYQDNANKTLDTLDGALQSMNMSAQDFSDEPKRLAYLQGLVQNAQGQTQAIQASAQISNEMVSQLQMLRQTMMTQANAQDVYYAQKVQEQATAQANLNKMVQAGSTDVPTYGSSGYYLHVPNF